MKRENVRKHLGALKSFFYDLVRVMKSLSRDDGDDIFGRMALDSRSGSGMTASQPPQPRYPLYYIA
jgi:hypothetical protein